ncbi:hypothetical protein BC938DRAFT_473767 [Jimgerdemannia flammicorona]|uniref:Uncharacterized protein n=1 Tax=Jimgerdemannia flammicorona TaxID=994334 RepID=A0A433QT17_9FUNG|nr:hypothetical protein BC938DRAFT_473767 [Jimgerdemannia flammicorona]
MKLRNINFSTSLKSCGSFDPINQPPSQNSTPLPIYSLNLYSSPAVSCTPLSRKLALRDECPFELFQELERQFILLVQCFLTHDSLHRRRVLANGVLGVLHFSSPKGALRVAGYFLEDPMHQSREDLIPPTPYPDSRRESSLPL